MHHMKAQQQENWTEHTHKEIHRGRCSLIGAKLIGQNTEATLIRGKAKAPVNEYSNPSDTHTIFAIFTGISAIQRAY